MQEFMHEQWEVLVEIDEVDPMLTMALGELIERGAGRYLAQIFDLLQHEALRPFVLKNRD